MSCSHGTIPPNWPVDTSAWNAAAEETRHRHNERLRVVTWNVWFDDFFMKERFCSIVEIILRRSPDVVCLQEVVPLFADTLKKSVIIGSLYDISANHVKPYGNLILTRKDLYATFSEISLDSMMGRSLLLAELRPMACPDSGDPQAWKAGVVGTVHLESLNSRSVRRKQLVVCNKVLSSYQNAVLCGDFNFDDLQEWGDWRRQPNPNLNVEVSSAVHPCHEEGIKNSENDAALHQGTLRGIDAAACDQNSNDGTLVSRSKSHHTEHKSQDLENRVLAEILPSFSDVWTLLRPHDRGATFDGSSNPYCVRDPFEIMRYDRVLMKVAPTPRWSFFSKRPHPPCWTASWIGLLGVERIDEDGLKPSDHYGLEFDCKPIAV